MAGAAYRRIDGKRTEAAVANGKVVINLATGLEDPERVTVAFLVGTAAVEQGRRVTMFLTKDAVRLGLPGHAEGVACDGCPPLERLFQQYTDGGGELLVCPICFSARKLDPAQLNGNTTLGGATPLWEWIGEERAEVFSY
jgi:predicted peroxiredoxin